MLENIYIKGIIGGIIGVLVYLFGGADALLVALMAMMGIDFVTGIIKAAVLKEITSQKMFLGGARKIGIFFIVAVANIIDGVLELGGVLRSVTIIYFIANEGVSLIENWSAMGLPIPRKLKEILLQLRDRNGKNEE
jgi:toxin secretion/phage lysis holin